MTRTGSTTGGWATVGIEGRGGVVRQVRTLMHLGAVGTLTDGQLLERFLDGPGETAELAFSALVDRHGPMVLRACRSILGDGPDAHDAFQATFLVLVRRARSLWVRDSIGPWLHQVAWRVARRTRSDAHRRQRHEQQAAALSVLSEEATRDTTSDDLGAILHEELARLPERFRAPWSCATWRARRTSGRRAAWDGRSGRSRAGSLGAGTASAPG